MSHSHQQDLVRESRNPMESQPKPPFVTGEHGWLETCQS